MADIRYLVDDVDEAVEFYTNHLGFTIAERWGPAFSIVSRGDLKLWLSGPQASAARPMPDGRQPVPGGWNRLVIVVEDMSQLLVKLKAANVVFRNEPFSGPGGKQVLIDDPSGNPVELFEPAE